MLNLPMFIAARLTLTQSTVSGAYNLCSKINIAPAPVEGQLLKQNLCYRPGSFISRGLAEQKRQQTIFQLLLGE